MPVQRVLILDCLLVTLTSTAALAGISTLSGSTTAQTNSHFYSGSGFASYAFDDQNVEASFAITATTPPTSPGGAGESMAASGLWNSDGLHNLSVSGDGAILGRLGGRAIHTLNWVFDATSSMTIMVDSHLEFARTSSGSGTVQPTLSLRFDDLTTGTILHSVVQTQVDLASGTYTDSFSFDLTHGHRYSLQFLARIHDWRGANVPGTMADSLVVSFVDSTPSTLDVEIDIKPGSALNSIRLDRPGMVKVALLTTPDFDAAEVDLSSVMFAGATVAEKSRERGFLAKLLDIDEDGDLDLLMGFRRELLDLEPTSISATLTGETNDGQAFEGTDSVRIVP